MLSLIFKAIFLYFLYLMLRGLWRGYKVFGAVQDAIRNGQHQGAQNYEQAQNRQAQSSQSDNHSSDIIEAEYRVVDSKKNH